MNILIRNLPPEAERDLELLAEHYNEKTASKTVLRLIYHHGELLEARSSLYQEIQTLRNQLNLLKGFSENIRYELSLLDSNYKE